jgi:AAA family ATP:ADP antiporter
VREADDVVRAGAIIDFTPTRGTSLNPLEQIRPGERRQTYAVAALLGGIMAGHALLETARDALFLARLPPARLAWVYLAIAVVSLVLFALQERGPARSGRDALAAWLVASAGVELLLWVLVAQPATWTLYVLYTWSGVFASLVVVRFWTVLGDLFSIGQAKRVFSLIGAGAVGGAIVGSLLARALADLVEPRHLLLASALVLVATALATHRLLPARNPVTTTDRRVEGFDLRWPLKAIWLRPYLRRVAGIVLLSAITLTLVDFLFKSAVAAHVPPDGLASFFASTYLVLNVLSLGAQLFAVSWLMRGLSVNRVLSILPALVVAATSALVLGGGLVAALALKGFDGVFRHSLHRTALEVLYVPLTGDLRSRVKGLIDVLGQRGGQAVASGVILAVAALSESLVPVAIGVIVILLALAWIRVAATLESHYLDLFRETLSEITTRTRLDFPEMDLESLETLLTHLNSADDSEVVAALDLFAEQQRTHLIPALILYHPSRVVVLRALELFSLSGRQDFRAILGLLLQHTDPEVRAAALRTHAWAFGPRQDLYLQLAEDRSPIVAATALVGLVSHVGGDGGQRARETIEGFAESGSHDERLALARAIRYSPGAIYTDILVRLAATSEVDTRIAVVQAMREILSARFIPVLLSMLPIRALRREARATLVAIGTEALRQLDAILGDAGADPDVRLHVPRTIAFFPPRSAAAVLMRHIETTEDGTLHYRVVRALGRCRAADPSLPLDSVVLARCLEQTLTDTFRFLDRRLALERGATDEARRATPVHELLVDLLRHRQTVATERLFRLVGLLYPSEDARSLYRGIHDPSTKVRDSSRELLEHLLDPPLQAAVLALVDDIPDGDRLARAHPYHEQLTRGYVDTLRALLDQGEDGTAELVAHHVGEIGADELAPRLEQLRMSPRVTVVKAVEEALAQLAPPEVASDGS